MAPDERQVAYLLVVTTGKLTRQELGWLLAQEARGAAKILRQDVTLLSTPPAVVTTAPAAPSESRVATTLNALDDAIGLLTELEAGPSGTRAPSRRGRIDLAALLLEFAPTASISIEPGAGTEVFGEDVELRRMLHVLTSQANFAGSTETASASVRIRREGEHIRITVTLGPDLSANADLERRWLSRMATRMGGRLELEGGTLSLVLPADAASDQREVEGLRKELEQAQQLGEAYARELATAFAAGHSHEHESKEEPHADQARRFELLVTLASALHRPLAALLHGLDEESGPSSSRAPHLAPAVSLLGDLGRIAACTSREPAELVDVTRVTREVVQDSEARASRHGLVLTAPAAPELRIRTRARVLSLLIRALVDHAIAATPRGGTVSVSLRGGDGPVTLTVTDGGPVVPVSARLDLLEHRVDPASLGRPPGIELLVAHTAAASLGGTVRLGESEAGAATAEATI